MPCAMDRHADQIAREAARLLEAGRADGIDAAIKAAASSIGDGGDQPLPSHAAVRRHARSMAMQALGESGYLARRAEFLSIAEELLAGLEYELPDAKVVLAGRAAAGHFDADPHLHVRVGSDLSITQIAASLVSLGYEEPAFATAESRRGRLDQLRFAEGGLPITVTRLPPSFDAADPVDLFTGAPVEIATVEGLRRLRT